MDALFRSPFGALLAQPWVDAAGLFGLRRWYVLTFLMGLFFVLGQAYEYYHLVTHGTTTR